MRIIMIISLLFMMVNAKDYRQNVKAKECIRTLVKKYDFSKKELNDLFSNVKVQKARNADF